MLLISLCGICANPPAYSGSHGVVISPSLSLSFTNTSNLTNFPLSYLIPLINNTSFAFSFSSSLLFTAGRFTRTFKISLRRTGNLTLSTVFTSPVVATCELLLRCGGRLLRHGNTSFEFSIKLYLSFPRSTQSLLYTRTRSSFSS
ncbi:hypothetical protein HanRHA438_Chr11g0488291 [Helianthus annuus]|uniref:Uncharacterized protein n=1 Tax=Helianthus annuus TaxID=4232 RepID=A0A9K3MYP3_HELAN|nr:hypothetical protein HanXRQr2_Chr11g0474871 [Helianthus annuus]KAJ0869357.1 hypothetical protein HanRHA438_Chr11g0488291 [Helianthus annuus]KAJ0873906.1 hypothetical protein HanPSC8_Chr11g0457911 [Helianthus annuus]